MNNPTDAPTTLPDLLLGIEAQAVEHLTATIADYRADHADLSDWEAHEDVFKLAEAWTPIYPQDVAYLWLHHGRAFVDAYADAGCGDPTDRHPAVGPDADPDAGWPLGYLQAAICCYLEDVLFRHARTQGWDPDAGMPARG